MPLMPSEANQLNQAQNFIRSHSKGELNFDDNIQPLDYIISPDGRLIAPVMVAVLHSIQTVLSIPDEGDPDLAMLLSLEELPAAEQRGSLPDRWRIYHGDPPDVNWAYLNIEMARLSEFVLDGEALDLSNPLSDQEASTVKAINQTPAMIQRICLSILKVDIDSPVMVGLDPSGFDIRGTFSVFRIPADHLMESAEEAVKTFHGLDPQHG